MYNFFNFLSDIGGVFQLIFVLFAIILYDVPKNISAITILQKYNYVLKNKQNKVKQINFDKNLIFSSMFGSCIFALFSKKYKKIKKMITKTE